MASISYGIATLGTINGQGVLHLACNPVDHLGRCCEGQETTLNVRNSLNRMRVAAVVAVAGGPNGWSQGEVQKTNFGERKIFLKFPLI